jgi:uncharacterized protein YbjT (DUF2867 family)
MKKEQILLLGATGTFGTPVVTKLINANLKFRVTTRSPEKLKNNKNVSVIEGDYHDSLFWEKLVKAFSNYLC